MSYAAAGSKTYRKLWPEAQRAALAGVPLVIDSGAFSAATTGLPVSLLGYTNWLRRNSRWKVATWVVSLDVVGDPVTSYRNHASMVRSGIENAVPTLHLGASPDWIDRYEQLGATRIALGGITALIRRLRGGTEDDVRRWLGTIVPRMVDRGMVGHGFGVTSQVLLTEWPWDTVDSTTFATGTRFRRLLFVRPNRRLQRVDLRHLEPQHLDYLARIGIDPRVLGNSFVVGENGHPQWRALLYTGLVSTAAAVSLWNPGVDTLFVSDWTMGRHVIPILTGWVDNPHHLQHATEQALVHVTR